MAKASVSVCPALPSTLIFTDPMGPVIWDLSLALHPEALERRGLLLSLESEKGHQVESSELLGHANRSGILVLAFM